MVDVPPGHTLVYGYVERHNIRSRQRGGLYLPAIQEHIDRINKCSARGQPAEAPWGHWEGELFVLEDGHHRFAALWILGFDHILVRWLSQE